MHIHTHQQNKKQTSIYLDNIYIHTTYNHLYSFSISHLLLSSATYICTHIHKYAHTCNKHKYYYTYIIRQQTNRYKSLCNIHTTYNDLSSFFITSLLLSSAALALNTSISNLRSSLLCCNLPINISSIIIYQYTY